MVRVVRVSVSPWYRLTFNFQVSKSRLKLSLFSHLISSICSVMFLESIPRACSKNTRLWLRLFVFFIYLPLDEAVKK